MMTTTRKSAEQGMTKLAFLVAGFCQNSSAMIEKCEFYFHQG